MTSQTLLIKLNLAFSPDGDPANEEMRDFEYSATMSDWEEFLDTSKEEIKPAQRHLAKVIFATYCQNPDEYRGTVDVVEFQSWLQDQSFAISSDNYVARLVGGE